MNVRLSELIVEKLHPAFHSDKTHIIITSGRAGTKSSFASLKIASELIKEEAFSGVVLRKHHNKLRKTVYKETIRGIGRLGLDSYALFKIGKSPLEITYKLNQNTVYFLGSDSLDDTKGIIDERADISLVVIDELTEFFDKGHGADELANIEATFIRGNNNENFKMFYLYNPPKNPYSEINKWLEMMKRRDDVLHIHLDYRDVPVEWLGSQLVKSAEQMKQADEKLYNWLWLGLSTGLDEVIYYMFNEDKHIKEVDYSTTTLWTVGIDYGTQNATTFQLFGVDMINKKVVGFDEYYYSGRETGKLKSPSEYVEDLKEFVETMSQKIGQRILYYTIDPSANAFKEEVRKRIPYLRAVPTNNDVKKGIERIQFLLSNDQIIFSPKQRELINEMRVYSYDPKSIDRGDEKPIKDNDHGCDAMRYFVMARWGYIMKIVKNYYSNFKDSM